MGNSRLSTRPRKFPMKAPYQIVFRVVEDSEMNKNYFRNTSFPHLTPKYTAFLRISQNRIRPDYYSYYARKLTISP